MKHIRVRTIWRCWRAEKPAVSGVSARAACARAATDCQEKVAEFRRVARGTRPTAEAAGRELEFAGGGNARQYPAGAGSRRMRARRARRSRSWNPRLARGLRQSAAAGGASFFAARCGARIRRAPWPESATPVLAVDAARESSSAPAANSLTLLNHHGSARESDGERAGRDRGRAIWTAKRER